MHVEQKVGERRREERRRLKQERKLNRLRRRRERKQPLAVPALEKIPEVGAE